MSIYTLLRRVLSYNSLYSIDDNYHTKVAADNLTPKPSPTLPSPCRYVVFDLGDVLFTWAPSTTTAVSPKQMKAILRSNTWYEYEKGNMGEWEAYNTIASEFSVSAQDVQLAFQSARESLNLDPHMLKLVQDLKRDYGVKFYGMSNISAPDYEYLWGKFADDFKLFDHVYTSAAAHERKPNLGFYTHVLNHSGIDPSQSVFVDDKPENVLSAMSVGMRGIVFSSSDEVSRRLINYCGSPIDRAIKWAEANKGLASMLDIGELLTENFSHMLAFEVCGKRDWVRFEEPERLFNFFEGRRGVGTTSNFPCDIDTTAIGLSITTHQTLETKHSIMDEILAHRTADGIVTTYFDAARPRIDPIICINALTAFYKYGRGKELDQTLRWVLDVLENKAYINGTYYYTTADLFLYFFSRLLDEAPLLRESHGSLFRQRCKSRIGADGDALSLALRVVTLQKVGETAGDELGRLLELQDMDGGFEVGWAFKYGCTGMRIGNRLLTTVMALKALGHDFR